MTAVAPSAVDAPTNQDFAHGAADLGYFVFVAHRTSEGKVQPCHKWRHGDGSSEYETPATRDHDAIDALFTKYGAESLVCIDTGRSGVLVVDLDVGHTDDVNGVEAWNEVKPTSYVFRGPIQRTRRDGRQLVFSDPDGTFRNTAGDVADGIDTRGVGGMIVAYGEGREWLAPLVEPINCPPIPAWLAERLTPKVSTETRAERPPGERGTLAELLGNPPTRGDRNNWLARVAGHFAALHPDKPDLYEQLCWDVVHHKIGLDDDFTESEATATVASIWRNESHKQYVRGLEQMRATSDDDPSEARPSTWAPVDAKPILNGEQTEPPPTRLVRGDGVALLYDGKVHSFNGESESAKSWCAQCVCAEALQRGEHVLYLDFEDGAVSVLGRLVALGVAPDVVAERFHYVRPDEPLSFATEPDLDDVLTTYAPTVAVVDGVTEAMTLQGLDLISNRDTAEFLRLLPRRLQRAGCAVVLIDHVVKAKDDRGRHAIGAQHKLAGIDCALVFDVERPFGRGLAGVVRIKVTKDRPGQVRPHAVGDRREHVATMHLRSDADTGAVRIELRTPDDTFLPTGVMESVSYVLANDENAEGLHVAAIVDAVGARRSTVVTALEALLVGGYVERINGRRGAKVYRHVRLYQAPAYSGSLSEEEPDEAF